MKKLLLSALFMAAAPLMAQETAYINPETVAKTVSALTQKFPEQFERVKTGVHQVARVWTKDDGSPDEFYNFCAASFFTGADLDTLFARLESKFEPIYGHFTALSLALRREIDENTGPLHPVDTIFASYAPDAHLQEDLFNTKLAFMILLNFPVETLDNCLEQGPQWSRRQWAQARLTKAFAHRVPAEVAQAVTKATMAAEEYINTYNIYMDHVVGPDGKPMFEPGLMLQSHWGLRDQIESYYSDSANLNKQKALYAIMERIINQDIPAQVVNSTQTFWNPVDNTVNGAKAEREPDTRYAKWLNVFKAHQLENRYYPEYPTYSDRSFNLEREIPEAQAQALFEELLNPKVGRKVATIVEERLGRPLLPFDVWYDGFKTRNSIPLEKLDKLCLSKYPTVESLQKDIPNILQKLGFDKTTAEFIASKVEIDSGRDAGSSSQADMRTEKAHIHVRFTSKGLDYQGFNTAMHELGHGVEQTFSLYKMDHYLLRGVPGSGFSEDFAFIFQDRDLFVLGMDNPDSKTEAMRTLDTFWAARETAGVALVDMLAWRWLGQNPNATPAQFREAVVSIAKDVWNKHFAPAFDVSDSPVLAIYSHMINYSLYLPNYAVGFILQQQIENYFKSHSLAAEMERMCKIGNVVPREWMRQAVGSDISAKPLVEDALKAAQQL